MDYRNDVICKNLGANEPTDTGTAVGTDGHGLRFSSTGPAVNERGGTAAAAAGWFRGWSIRCCGLREEELLQRGETAGGGARRPTGADRDRTRGAHGIQPRRRAVALAPARRRRPQLVADGPPHVRTTLCRVTAGRHDVAVAVQQSAAGQRGPGDGGRGRSRRRRRRGWRVVVVRVQPQPPAVLPVRGLLRRPVHTDMLPHVLRQVRSGQEPGRQDQLSAVRVSVNCCRYIMTSRLVLPDVSVRDG